MYIFYFVFMDCLVYGGVGEDSVEDGAVDWLQGWVQDHGLELHGDWITVCIYLFLLAIVWKFKISWLTVPWEKNNMVSFINENFLQSFYCQNRSCYSQTNFSIIEWGFRDFSWLKPVFSISSKNIIILNNATQISKLLAMVDYD